MHREFNQCKQFSELCGCKETYIRFLDIGQASEHFLAVILCALVEKNVSVREGRGMLVCNYEAMTELDYKVRCDGTLYVGSDYLGNQANYNFVCMPTMFTAINAWKRANPGGKFIHTMDRVLHKTLGEPGMQDATVLLNMYADAAR